MCVRWFFARNNNCYTIGENARNVSNCYVRVRKRYGERVPHTADKNDTCVLRNRVGQYRPVKPIGSRDVLETDSRVTRVVVDGIYVTTGVLISRITS